MPVGRWGHVLANLALFFFFCFFFYYDEKLCIKQFNDGMDDAKNKNLHGCKKKLNWT